MPNQIADRLGNDTVLPTRLHTIESKFHLRRPAKQDIGQALKRIAEDVDDVRSMTDIAKALNVPRGYLKYWFPESCLAISARHKKHTISLARKMRAIQQNEVRIATFRIFSAGVYPSGRKVRQAIRPLKLCLKRPELRAAQKKALKYLQG